jgi:hypothetical protein
MISALAAEQLSIASDQPGLTVEIWQLTEARCSVAEPDRGNGPNPGNHPPLRSRDDPEQFRAIGFCGGRLCSVIFEIRHDAQGEFYHLVTAWEATSQEERDCADNI